MARLGCGEEGNNVKHKQRRRTTTYRRKCRRHVEIKEKIRADREKEEEDDKGR